MPKTEPLRRWERSVADFGCVVTGSPALQVHHVVGRTYRHAKVLIGPWYIIPLAVELHDVGSNHPHNVTHWPKAFAKAYGYQRDLFLGMVSALRRDGIEIPFDEDVVRAIRDAPLR